MFLPAKVTWLVLDKEQVFKNFSNDKLTTTLRGQRQIQNE